ncbi:hypothetical protein Q5P01_005724 [Channa striata]|uniref:Uncharacterized protein n=1 Tax=Channa striata TaxID=64152 RepID=A0AA88SZS1_CHASR|nr:hypothetical protein Q5P01_005724 [Channa striata]
MDTAEGAVCYNYINWSLCRTGWRSCDCFCSASPALGLFSGSLERENAPMCRIAVNDPAVLGYANPRE